MDRTESYDCLVLGAGPAGLTAGLYLARFRRKVIVIDGGASRAALIPVSRNYPGFPPGIGGVVLLDRLRRQALRYGVQIEPGEIEAVAAHADGFQLMHRGRRLQAPTLLLATGIEDNLPKMPDLQRAIREARVRLCPICDGYEVSGEHVAVYGEVDCAIRHALFLRTFTDKLSVIVQDDKRAQPELLERAGAHNIRVLHDRVEQLRLLPDRGIGVRTQGGQVLRFDIVYPVLGSRSRCRPIQGLNPARDEEGALRVDEHQRTSIAGLYAAGDVTTGLKQVCVAIGQATIAATHIHNNLPPNPWGSPTG